MQPPSIERISISSYVFCTYRLVTLQLILLSMNTALETASAATWSTTREVHPWTEIGTAEWQLLWLGEEPDRREKNQTKTEVRIRMCRETETQSLPFRLSRLIEFASTWVQVPFEARCTQDSGLQVTPAIDASMSLIEKPVYGVTNESSVKYYVKDDSYSYRSKRDRIKFANKTKHLVDNRSCVRK